MDIARNISLLIKNKRNTNIYTVPDNYENTVTLLMISKLYLIHEKEIINSINNY
jgi:hypothetical protein